MVVTVKVAHEAGVGFRCRGCGEEMKPAKDGDDRQQPPEDPRRFEKSDHDALLSTTSIYIVGNYRWAVKSSFSIAESVDPPRRLRWSEGLLRRNFSTNDTKAHKEETGYPPQNAVGVSASRRESGDQEVPFFGAAF